MELQLFVSQSGLGKTSKIISDIKIEKMKDSKIIIITPEQNSYNFEKLLCENFNGTFNIEVVNFKSLTRKFSNELNIEDLSISETVKTFYYLEIANRLKDKNNFLVNRMIKDINFISVVDDMITEFKEYVVSVNDLNDYLLEIQETDTNKEKISAISEIYFEYMSLLAEKKQYDRLDYINQLIMLLDYIDLSNYVFYIDGYFNFSRQEYIYIQKIIEKSKKTVISINLDFERYLNVKLKTLFEGYDQKVNYYLLDLETVNKNPKYNLDIFRKSHEIIANINSILRNLKINRYYIYTFLEDDLKAREIQFILENNEISNYYFSENVNLTRYKNEELKHLVFELPKITKSTYKGDIRNISIISANNIQLELKEVSRKIVELTNSSTEKFNNDDIAILYRDRAYERYSYIFKDYNIPVHLDVDQDVTFHRLIKFIKNMFEFNEQDFINSLNDILKTGLVDFKNIYVNIACQYILLEDTSLNKQLENINFDGIDFSKFDSIININTKIKSLENLKDAIVVPNLSSLEHVLRYKNIKNRLGISSDKFLEPIENFSSQQLTLISKTLQYILSIVFVFPVNDNKTVTYYIKKLDKIFNEFNINMSLDREIQEYDEIKEFEEISIDRQVYSKVLNILNDMQQYVGDYKVEFKQFKDILFHAFSKIKYRSIPIINNMVVMSSMDLAKIENKKVVFVLGYNQGVIPSNSINNSIIDDSIKENLILKNIYLSPTNKNMLIDEEFVSYIALSRVSSKVIISYSNLGSDYREQNKSIYLDTVENIFPNIKTDVPSKIINFSQLNIDYYLNNLKEIYCLKEFCNLYSKILMIYFDLSLSQNKNNDMLLKIKELIKKFNNIKFEEAENAINNEVINYYLSDEIVINEKSIVRNYYEYIKNDYNFNIDEEIREKYLERNINSNVFSASKIQDYSNNPYIYFIKRLLKVKEPVKYGINPLNSGSFYHKIFEHEGIIKFIQKKGQDLALNEGIDEYKLIKYRSEIKEEIIEAINNIKHPEIREFLNVINANKTNDYLFYNMLERLINSILVEIQYNAISSFATIDTEYSFEFTIKGKKIISTKSGNELSINLSKKYNIPDIKLIGNIDRIDCNGDKYLVVDYKSSETKFNLESFYNGEISQLLTYAIALLVDKDIELQNVLGIFYREIAKSKNIKIKDYRLRGIINSDLLLLDDVTSLGNNIMFGARVTKKNEVDKRDQHQTYATSEFKKMLQINLENILSKIEKIWLFDFGVGSILDEQNSLFKYANIENTVLDKDYVKLKNEEYKKGLLQS